ncbi:MAG: long-chain fatty acid--CoA ligase [Actinobacteria bacterium]|nr:long-chain fatty acid--CoA ligase [Actinomycetota bacterium]MCL6104641.1 long-chain fatty acid--CoA ligase [Actinomycetota bacterium]
MSDGVINGVVDLDGVDTVPNLFAQRVKLTPDAIAWFTRQVGEVDKVDVGPSFADKNGNFIVGKDGSFWKPTTWLEFDREVKRVARGLFGLGARHGNGVGVIGWTKPEWCIADLAIQSLGGICVGIYPTLTPEQIAFMLQDSGCVGAVVEDFKQVDKILEVADSLPLLKWIVVWEKPRNDQRAKFRDKQLIDWSELGITPPTALSPPASTEPPESFGSDESFSPAPDDIAVILYTSGTTGRPKGVLISHKAVCNLMRLAVESDIVPGDITMAFLPMAHGAEHLLSFYSRIRFGSAAGFARAIDTVIEDAQEIRPTYFGSVPRIFEKIYQKVWAGVDEASLFKKWIFKTALNVGDHCARASRQGVAPSLFWRLSYPLADKMVLSKLRGIFGGRVRYFVSGAAPISVDILEFFHACGMLILEGYGPTEAGGITHINRIDDFRFGTVGKPLPTVECKIAPDGEILLYSPAACSGYHNLKEETAKLFDPNGWVYTGDIGEIDSDGFLRITDRKKHLLKTAGGKYIAPSPIEIAIQREDPIIGQVFVEAEGRNFVTALVALDTEELPKGALEEDGSVALHICQRIADAIGRANSKLARFENVRKFAIVTKGFSLEGGELTPTLKVRREQVRQIHGEILDRLYDDPDFALVPSEVAVNL